MRISEYEIENDHEKSWILNQIQKILLSVVTTPMTPILYGFLSLLKYLFETSSLSEKQN